MRTDLSLQQLPSKSQNNLKIQKLIKKQRKIRQNPSCGLVVDRERLPDIGQRRKKWNLNALSGLHGFTSMETSPFHRIWH